MSVYFARFLSPKPDICTQFCSLYEVRPSQIDLVDHTHLINEAVKRDRALENSKVCLLVFLLL